MAPNKTLAAQLFAEFKELFPHNEVEYFVSYYDYYQPEAYIPASDTYQLSKELNYVICWYMVEKNRCHSPEVKIELAW